MEAHHDKHPVDEPLSWKQARSNLRKVLEDYYEASRSNKNKNETTRTVKINNEFGDSAVAENKRESNNLFLRLLTWWLENDLDLYIGALTSSILLLVIASFSFESKRSGYASSVLHISDKVDMYLYRSSLVASIILVVGALISIWIVHRRRFPSSNDADTAKRREILRFLTAMKRQEGEDRDDVKNGIGDNPSKTKCRESDRFSEDTQLNLNGTALTDIYPVYRLGETRNKGNDFVGSWTRIPTLLLGKGDYVALQVGDVSPAKCCKLLDNSVSSFEIKAGERITLDSIGETADGVTASLPRGRSTLPSDSLELLTLCNRMRIFVLKETPLEEFLRRPQVPSKPPIVLRQMKAVRAALSITSFLIFAATAIIAFSRPGITSGDMSFILPLPLLASIGLFPLIAPAFIIYLEILGTARILVAVHPHARVVHESHSGTGNSTRHTRSNAKFHLLRRYIFATTLSRLSLWETAKGFKRVFDCRWLRRRSSKHVKPGEQKTSSSDYLLPQLVRVPPACVHLLEKLGAATAFTLVDDELACEPHALPQQLLIPSEKGLKLLDICPTYDDDSIAQQSDYDANTRSNDHDSDSDSDDNVAQVQSNFSKGRKKIDVFRRRRKRKSSAESNRSESDVCTDEETLEHEVQFEDPLWWQHLPALKCIGLGCLLVGEASESNQEKSSWPSGVDSGHGCTEADVEFDSRNEVSSLVQNAKSSLVRLICAERRSNQLRSLAQCVGFSTERNSFGERGDLSPFTERLRLHVISNMLLKERLEIDPHERGSEESRWWGLLHPDATSVVVRDSRSQAYQLLTVGDPVVVTSLCHEAWQGENSTILPLASTDRATILDTSVSWKLANLDVTAFSYSPVPSTLDRKFGGDDNQKPRRYLLTQSSRVEQMHAVTKEKSMSEDWSLINNQIFLGVLGSLVIPRKEIRGLLNILMDAGVRFVYFSPRNMRRQKELASQMGIDVAWNCAISLRPLESGEDDPHRMVSQIGDWDVNAKLPHGIENVRKHLREVDNVPLLVSLFTDVTKQTTMEMVETFQEYHDTVIAVGLSHLPRNSFIFSTADIAVGVDMIDNTMEMASSRPDTPNKLWYNCVLPSEVTFVSAISAHSCAFRLRGPASVSQIPSIIAQGRAALEAATSSAIFFVSACLSFSLYVLFGACTVATTVPYIPTLGAVLYLQILLPGIGLAMAMSDPDDDSMNRVPPKNDQTITFGRQEGRRLYYVTFLKAILPAILSQILYLVAFGTLLIEWEPDLVEELCLPDVQKGDWVSVIRCNRLREYSGVARTSSGALALGELILCTIVASASFVHRTIPMLKLPPWRGNRAWVYSVIIALMLVLVLLLAVHEGGSLSALPWYYYILAILMPFVCLMWNEICKEVESKHLRRTEKLRRLQFETRLGMWSPK